MRRIFGFLLLFALVFPLEAENAGVEIRIDPPAPTSRTPLEATISGLWGDGCPPREPVVSVSGGTIRISLSVSQHPCPILPIVPVQWKETAFIGLVPPGSYEVEAVVSNAPFGVIARTTVFVRDADAVVQVEPSVIIVSGGLVRIHAPTISGCPPNVSPCQPPIVEFNGIRSAEVSTMNGHIVARVPFLAPGPIDVVVRTFDGTYTAEDALYLADRTRGYNATLFDRILVPILWSGPGAFGSQWTTDVWVHNANEYDVPFLNPAYQVVDCPIPEGCPIPLPAKVVRKIEGQWQHGLYLFPVRGSSERIHVNALVRDLSRQSEALGTELPIVREDDFRETVVLLNVPSDRRFRVALRIYAFSMRENVGLDVPISIYRMNSSEPIVASSISLRPPANPAYEPMNVTLTDILTQLAIPQGEPLRIEIGGPSATHDVWAFASVTNNATQHLTIISPQ